MKLKTKYNFIVFLLILIIFQFYFVNILPITFLGFSFYLSLFLILTFAIFLLTIKTQKKDNIILFVGFLFLYLFVSFVRYLLYSSDSDILSKLIMNFAFYLPPVFLMLTSDLGTLFNKKLPRVLLLLLLTQAILAVLFILGLPTINLLTDDLPDGYLRYVGIMGGANVNANFNTLIMTVLLLSPNKYTISKKIFIITLGIISTAPSFTKLSFLVTFVIIGYVIYDFIKTNNSKAIWLFIPLIVISSFFLIKNNSKTLSSIRTVDRIISTVENGGDKNRADKYAFGLSLVLSDLTSFVIGPASERKTGRYVEFSDNSFLQMPLSLGFPIFILFLLLIKKLSKYSKHYITKESTIYLLILLITFFLNNAILWIPWLFLASIGYWSIVMKKSVKQNFN